VSRAGEPTSVLPLLSRYRSASRSLSCWLRITERHGSLIHLFTGGAAIEAQRHYPSGDLIDAVSGTQCYYHCHRGDVEHGHLHLFRRASPGEPLTHLIGISLDPRGLPVGLFTVNRWVTRDVWRPAAETLGLIDGVSLSGSGCDPDLSRWLRHFLAFYRPLLNILLRQRDHRLKQGDLERALEDRQLEILSSGAIDWSADLAATEDRLRSVRQAEAWAQPHADRGAEQREDDPEPAVQAGGGDAAEVGAHIAAVGEPGAVAHRQTADQGGDHGAAGGGAAEVEAARQ
jgi:hypothetical protein